MGVPQNHPFLGGIFHEINQPASLGNPHDELETLLGNPPFIVNIPLNQVDLSHDIPI